MSEQTHRALNLGCLFPFYCSGANLSQIFVCLCRNWRSERLRARMIVPNASAACRGPGLTEAVPVPLKWLVYRIPSLPKLLAERRLLGGLDAWDAVYSFPDISLRSIRRIQAAGLPIFLERINCLAAKTLRILRPEYRRLGLEPQNPFHKWETEPERCELRHADFLFCPSPEVELSLLEDGAPAGKLIAASYGWSPEQYPDAGAPREERETVSILFVGYICVRKGVHLLLRAWERAGIRGRLILCGAIEPALAPLMKQALARPEVIHLPYTPDVGPVYRMGDVFAFPSLEEGGPLVTYEAMAHGLAMVTSPMGAGAILRDGSDGIVIPPHDTDAWVEALRRLAGSAELRRRLGAAACFRAKEFTWDKVARRRADAILQKLGGKETAA